MSVEDLKVVDFVAKGPDGRWFLVVSDHLEWLESVKHQYKLQKKLNSYMTFIETGQIYEQYPDARGQQLVIDVRFMHMPGQEAWEFLERVRNVVERSGIQFECKMLKTSVN